MSLPRSLTASLEADPWSEGLGCLPRSLQPPVPSTEESQKLKTCLQTAAQALLWNYSTGCPCPRIKQSLPLIRVVINVIVKIAINST